MIGIKDDGFETLRWKLRSMSEAQLIQFGKDARKRFQIVHKELELVKLEWLARHPRRPSIIVPHSSLSPDPHHIGSFIK